MKMKASIIALTAFLEIVIIVNIVRAQQEDPGFDLRPLVSVNPGRNYYEGTNVGVNVPGIYNMDLNAGGFDGTGLGINVLRGLVRVNLQRNRNPFTGRRRGPISVDVAGIPIFNNFND